MMRIRTHCARDGIDDKGSRGVRDVCDRGREVIPQTLTTEGLRAASGRRPNCNQQFIDELVIVLHHRGQAGLDHGLDGVARARGQATFFFLSGCLP